MINNEIKKNYLVPHKIGIYNIVVHALQINMKSAQRPRCSIHL